MKQDYTPAVTKRTEAEAAGYAGFNGYPHLCVDVPNGGFTVTCKTQDGKRMTFCFVPYAGGEPGCCDIQLHDSPISVKNGQRDCPVMHSIGFTPGNTSYDTRKLAKPTTLITVLMADKDYPKAGAQ